MLTLWHLYSMTHIFSCVELALVLLIPIITGDNHLVCKVLQFNYSYKFNHWFVIWIPYIYHALMRAALARTKIDSANSNTYRYLSCFIRDDIYFVVGLLEGSEAVGGGGGPLRANSSKYPINSRVRSAAAASNTRNLRSFLKISSISAKCALLSCTFLYVLSVISFVS